jgi:hypothetical protein
MQALHRRIARRARRLPDRAGESIARRRGLRALRERTDEPSRVLARVETRHGRFEDTLGPALEELGEVALAFVDGHHDEGATIAYWERIAPRLARPALVVFDDIRWSDGMTRAWRAIAADARVELALDLRALGVCVVGAGGEAQEIEVPLDDR